MKTNANFIVLFGMALAGASLLSMRARAEGTNAPPERVGVYDSRVVAYADFWTEAHQRKIADLTRDAKAAQASGQTARARELGDALKQEQEKSHLRVFSTAPVDDILAGMKDRVEAVQKSAGVTGLVSKWDEKALARVKSDQRVDVTDQLLALFKLTDQQKKVVEEMRKQAPLPLDQAEEMMRKGEL